ncbi:hypothetical protein [Agrococcus casei]|uniref:hypothetical protein n=1 Tax=Agrococcus casei TaxID=343512 RepID=UPI003F8E0B19
MAVDAHPRTAAADGAHHCSDRRRHAANAWFYLRNADLSGSWYRSTPKSPVFDRAPRTTGEVLTDPEFWFVPLLRYVGRGTSEFAQTALLVSGLVIGALLLVTLIAGTRRIASARLRPDARRAVLFLALVFHVVGHYAAQLSHANGYGALNFRYFMPATLALAFIIAVGCVLLGRAGMVTIAAATAALGLLNAISVTVYAASMRNIEGYSVTLPAALVHQNGLSPWLALVCAGAAVAACLTFTVASSLLRSEPQTVNSDQRTRI